MLIRFPKSGSLLIFRYSGSDNDPKITTAISTLTNADHQTYHDDDILILADGF